MLKYFINLIVLFFTLNTFAQLWLVDPLEAIYPDINDLSNYNNKWKADFPKGVIADAHVLVKLPIGSSFTITAYINENELDDQYLSQLLDVPVEQNTGLDSRTEQFINKINPYVIRRAPFRIFEVIHPVQNHEFKSDSDYTAFRLSIPPALTTGKGMYKIHIKVHSGKLVYEGIFSLKIHDVPLPELSDSQFFYTNWFNLNNMEKYHHLERWSDVWFQMLDKYARLMAHGRQNSITIPGELIQWRDNEFSLDAKKMLRFIDVFRKYGFQYFEAPHLLNRGEEDDWGDPELKVSLTKKRYYTENGKEDIQKLMTLIKNFTTTNELTDNWLQHIADEPTSVNARCYKDVAKQLKEIYPEIKIMEATNARDSIAGAIDIWCPIIDDFQEKEAFFRKREALGEKVLVYTCLVPGGPWLNRTMDMEKLRQVYFGWGAAFYNTGGYLHWGLNQYQADPFEQSVVKHPSPVASSNNYLPAGDTHIIYPGKKGPLSSIRFESHRIGSEDYELLQRLKKRKLRLHDKLINNLFRSYTDYNLEIAAYRKTKRKLLKALN
jgi:hypothetical protein